ncbi:sepiapterin reductase [Amblyraja radiata]|uniref:sepiapterin reductase n=1 Tax=Amblyraja radiata TaxID=386614 RepID=UPI00140331FF|nr:sepiapterin reductase [Amblyraja radiata]
MAVRPSVKGTSLCIVTGASRGLGRALALGLSASLQPGSQLVVAARCGEALRELRDGAAAAGSGVDVCPVQADLSGDAGLREVVRAVQRQQQQHGAPDRLLIINNAGELLNPDPTLHPTGPLDNSMHEQARKETGDPELRKMFVDMHRQGQLLTCQESARKLLEILAKDEFESGAHIDYFDP